ncbi:hypothetical protein ASD37_07095 [Mycobacterium sp. Root135]|nr:hypothetical protein ASD37_07095 [Mycobacterium sp. Root135]
MQPVDPKAPGTEVVDPPVAPIPETVHTEPVVAATPNRGLHDETRREAQTPATSTRALTGSPAASTNTDTQPRTAAAFRAGVTSEGQLAASSSAVQVAAAAIGVAAVTPAAVTPQVPSLPQMVLDTVRGVVGAILAPFANPLPVTPDSSPLLLMVEWFRRTAVGAFYNRAPVASPLQIGEDAGGRVTGVVGATDPDGDPLTYALAQGPTHGSVVVHRDGTYTFTPDAALARDGGTDTFTVTVRDQGVRLLSQAGVTTVSVGVQVGAGDALGVNGTPFAVAVSRDGKRAYVTDTANSRVSVLDIATRSVIGSIAVGGGPAGIAVADDGRAYVVNSADGTVTVFDTATNAVVRPYVYVGSGATGIAVNATGTRVVVANGNEDSVSVIDTGTYGVTRVVVGDGPYGVAISGNRALITNEYDDTVSVLDLTTNTVTATIAVGDAPTGIAAAGNRAVVTNAGSTMTPDDGTVSIIDLDTLTVIGSPIAAGDSPVAVVIDATGTRAYVADMEKSTVSVLDIATGVFADDELAVAGGTTGLALGGDGSLYTAGYLQGAIDPVDVGAPHTIVVDTAALASATAATPTAAAQEWSTVTKGFDLFNDTSQNVVLTYEGDGRPNGGGPAEGTVLAPGAHLHLEIPGNFFAKSVRVVLTSPTQETWTIHMPARNFFGYIAHHVWITHSGGTGTYEPIDPYDRTAWQAVEKGLFDLVDFSDRTTARVLDAPNTTKTLDAGDPDAASILGACAKDSRATCAFTPVGNPTSEWSQWQPALTRDGTPAQYVNGGQQNTPRSFDVVHTAVSHASDGLGVRTGLALANSVATIKTPTGQPLSTTNTYTGTTPTYDVPANTSVQVLTRAPLLRYVGSMTVTVGNSVITVTNITYDVPDPSRALDFSTKLTPTR